MRPLVYRERVGGSKQGVVGRSVTVRRSGELLAAVVHYSDRPHAKQDGPRLVIIATLVEHSSLHRRNQGEESREE